MAFITETAPSNASGSGAEEIWEKLKSSLLKAADNVCGSTKKHQWRKETWWWNAPVDSAVKEKRGCWKTWKKGDSKKEYQKTKCLAKQVVYLVKSQAKQEVLQDPSASSSDLFRIANQIWHENLDAQVEKAVRNDAEKIVPGWQGQASYLRPVSI